MRFRPCSRAPGPGAEHIGRQVLAQAAHGPHEAELADVHELVHPGHAADDDLIADDHVTGQAGGVGHDHAVAQDTVVGHVYIGHEQAVVADAGHAAAVLGAAMDGAELAEDVVVAHFQKRLLAVELEVLGLAAHDGVGVETVVAAHAGVGLDLGTGLQDGPVSHGGALLHDAERADADVLAQFGTGIDHGGGMDCHAHASPSRSTMAAVNSA